MSTQNDPEEGIEVTVRGENLDDALDKLHLDGIDVDPPEELEPVVEFMTKLYQGVREADKHGGKSKSMIAKYAGVDDRYIGNGLRVLEREGLVENPDNTRTWKLLEE